MTELYESREGDPVERYLDELLPLLPGHPGDVRRALAEVEDHLRESKSQAMAQGADEQSASMQAVERFGTPAEVARKFRSARPALDARTVRAVVRSLWLLGAIGFISIGLSGLIAAAFGAIEGKGFVSGDLPDVTYTAARCADYLEYHPEAGSCRAAATAHHYDEIVTYRLAAGVLGLVALALYVVARRRGWLDARLPWVLTASVAAGLFGVVGAVLMLASVNYLAAGRDAGAGGQLSAGVVSLVVAAGFAWTALRRLPDQVADG